MRVRSVRWWGVMLVGIGAAAGAAGCYAPQRAVVPMEASRTAPIATLEACPQEELARRDPLAFLKYCRERYVENVADYRCRFHVRERIAGRLGAQQEMAVLFRERPFSVNTRWIRGAGLARRVTYVSGRWHQNGREQAAVYPSGLLAVLAPMGVKRDIHAPDMRAAARRTIDQFGFKNTLDLFIRFCEMAEGDPAYQLRFVGFGKIAGRPTLVLERRLPFSVEGQPYPDRLQVINIDCEWLIPTGCFAYADDAGQQLLGSYVATDVEFNVGLTDKDF